MPEPGDYGRPPEQQRPGHGPGYTQAAGFGPQNPRMRPPETPPQFQRNSPPRQDGTRPRQPQYAPSPYAPRPPRRPSWAARHKGLTVFLSLCGLVFVIGIAAAAASPSSSSPSAASAPPPAQTQAAVPPASSRAAVAAAKTVATFSGSGITNTAQFTVSSTWKLDYSFDCSNFGYAGNFIVMEDGGLSSAMNVNELAMSKTGSSYAYDDAGTHYIEVNSECSWTLKVIAEG